MNHRELWVCGHRHIQPYQNTGSVEIFDVIPGALIETGNISPFSPALLDNSILWVGEDDRGACVAWRSQGYTPQRISTHAVEADLSATANTANMVSYSYQNGGHFFWVIYVPGSQWSWTFDVAENLWHKRAQWVNGVNKAHKGWNHVYAFGKHLVGDWGSGNIYDMSMSYYDDAGSLIRRVRRAPTISDELKRVYHSEMRIEFAAGLAPQPPLLDGNNAPRAPQVSLRWSDNAGETWGNEHWRGVGLSGEYGAFARWNRLGRSRRRVYEMVVTDPVPWALTDAYLRTGASDSL